MPKILCIEDEADYREGLVDFLSRSGFEVDEAEDGESGMLKVLNGDHDLILCDIKLPRKNGYDILKEIREIHSDTPAKPFIFLSAFGHNENIRTGFDMGASYLVKPVDFDLLLSKINFRLSHHNNLQTLTARAEKHSRNTIIRSLRDDITTTLKLVSRFSEVIMNQEFGQIAEPRYAAYAKMINEFSFRLASMVNEITQTAAETASESAKSGCSDMEAIMWKVRLRLDDIHDVPYDAVDFCITESEKIISAEAELVAKMVSNIAASIAKKGEHLQKIVITSSDEGSGMVAVSIFLESLAGAEFRKTTLRELVGKNAIAGNLILPLEFAEETTAAIGGKLLLFAEETGGIKAILHLPVRSE